MMELLNSLVQVGEGEQVEGTLDSLRRFQQKVVEDGHQRSRFLGREQVGGGTDEGTE